MSVRVDAQEKTIFELKKGVNNLTKSARFEKERAIKLESHSRRITWYSIEFLKKWMKLAPRPNRSFTPFYAEDKTN